MKQSNILSMAIVLILAVTAFSCTPMTGMQDDGVYERSSVPGRVYVEDPYRGTVVLERDPYTGRYYEVGSYGSSNYGRNQVYRDSRYYGRNDSRGYNRNYNGNRNNGSYRGNSTPQRPAPAQPAPEQKKERDDARRKILGN